MTENFGKKIRALRREANLTQADIADAIGTSVAYVSQVEAGAKGPLSILQIRKLSHKLGRTDLLMYLCMLALRQSGKIEIETASLTDCDLKMLVEMKLSRECME